MQAVAVVQGQTNRLLNIGGMMNGSVALNKKALKRIPAPESKRIESDRRPFGLSSPCILT